MFSRLRASFIPETLLTALIAAIVVASLANSPIAGRAAFAVDEWGRTTTGATSTSTTLSTPAALDPLTWSVGANETHTFSYLLGVAGPTAADLKLQLAAPVGAVWLAQAQCLRINGSDATTDATSTVFIVDGSPLGCGTLGPSTYYFIRLSGWVATGANPGTVALQMGQHASDAGSVTVGDNSTVRRERVQ